MKSKAPPKAKTPAPKLPILPPPPPRKFPKSEPPTGRRNQKVSDFYQLGQLYDELKPEFQRALMSMAHTMLKLQNESGRVQETSAPEIHIQR